MCPPPPPPEAPAAFAQEVWPWWRGAVQEQQGGSKEAREEAPERGPGAEVRRALQELRNLR